MTENVHVVGERLIAYLYDEADAGERALVDAHLRVCAACAEELAGLGATRQHLGEWAPPDVALGFQIARPVTMPEAPVTATVLRPARWWQQPTPAWVQVAAAFLIFAAGLSLGQSRPRDSQAAAPPLRTVAATSPQSFTASPPSGAASPQVADLAREVAQLRQQIAALSSAPSMVSAARAQTTPVADADVLTRVRALIADSEAGLRTDMTLRDAQLAREIELQRRQDLERVSRSIDVVNGQMGAEVRQQRQTIEGLAKVVGSFNAAPGR